MYTQISLCIVNSSSWYHNDIQEG